MDGLCRNYVSRTYYFFFNSKDIVITADQLLKTITGLKIEITPTVNLDNEVIHWYAGFKKASGYGNKGLVNNTDLARGRSIGEAVEKLLAGQTMYAYSEDGTGITEVRGNW